MPQSRAEIASQLADFFAKWSRQTKPVVTGERVTLQGLDCSNPDPATRDLYFTDGPDHIADVTSLPVMMANQDFLKTNTLRNGFFPEVFRKHTAVNNLHLVARGKGRFHLSIRAHAADNSFKVLGDAATATAGAPLSVTLPGREAIPEATRLEAVVQSRAGKSRLDGLTWETAAPHDTAGRMVVLLRTFGRTRDIVALFAQLKREAAQSGPGGDYAHFLRNTAFVVLDSTPGVGKRDYASVTASKLFNVFVYAGANLGGGGNMSQVMLHARQALTQADVTAGEVLLLDDDLGISLESLRRNWAASLFRKDTTIFTLPVFLQTIRRSLWEDGSMWGRFAGGSLTGKREVIRPRFLRHGRKIRGAQGIEDLGAAHYPEYATFIFQSQPIEALVDIGYPAAFFLRGDDIEYSLRARARGHTVFSNPNLASWHEPAHSYGQEYMSISHGLIVNLCYGQENAGTVVQFFLQRALAHLAIADPLGLELYATVLGDINGCETFLAHGFAERYVQRLAEFRRFDEKYEHLPPEIVNDILAQNDRASGQAEHHYFLYMVPEKPLGRSKGVKKARKRKYLQRTANLGSPLNQVILTNPNTGAHYIYRPQDADQAAALTRAAARLYAEIDRFARDFDTIKAHYNKRMGICAQADFWESELAAQPSPPSLILQGLRHG